MRNEGTPERVMVGGERGPSVSVTAGDVLVVGKTAPVYISVYPAIVITGRALAAGVIRNVESHEFP